VIVQVVRPSPAYLAFLRTSNTLSPFKMPSNNLFSLPAAPLLLTTALLFSSLAAAIPFPQRLDDMTFRPRSSVEVAPRWISEPSDHVETSVLGPPHGSTKPLESRAEWPVVEEATTTFDPREKQRTQKRSSAGEPEPPENSLRGDTKVYSGSYW